jgi:hypothetical protein
MDSTPYHADTEVSRCGYGRRAKDSNCLVKVQGARKSMGSLGVHSLSDQSLDIVSMVHQCADVSKLKAVNPVWELSEVNWFNHLRLVSVTCASLWSGRISLNEIPELFARLLSLWEGRLE